MTYEEYLKKIEEIEDISYNVYTEDRAQYLTEYSRYSSRKREKKDDVLPYKIIIQSEIGGVEGGSCWESSNPQHYERAEGYEEGTLKINELLAKVFEAICPDISFLKYNIIYTKLIETHEYTDYGYYGNQTEYCVKSIDLRNLYNVLVEHEIINNDSYIESASIT